jgi:hypothetical protein
MAVARQLKDPLHNVVFTGGAVTGLLIIANSFLKMMNSLTPCRHTCLRADGLPDRRPWFTRMPLLVVMGYVHAERSRTLPYGIYVSYHYSTSSITFSSPRHGKLDA